MFENRQGEYESRFLMDASKDSSRILNECVFAFAKEHAQVEEDGSFFTASEDEVIGVEHLLAEPKYNVAVDGVLGLDACNPQKCFNVEEFSAVEFGYMKTDSDAVLSHLTQGERTKSEFVDGVLEETDNAVFAVPDTCEDYLLDTEFDEDISNFIYVPRKGSCLENLDLEHNSAGSGGTDCGAEILEPSTGSIPVLEATWDKNSSLLAEMTVDELHSAFRNMFGRETAVTDKQWLKRRISFGFQNLDELDNGLSHVECHVTSNENEEELVWSTSDEGPVRVSSPFSAVFNFKRKPRVQHVKRERPAVCDSLKSLSSEVSNVVFGFPDLGEKESMLVTEKRLRKPTQRYIEESLEQNLKYQRRRCGISDRYSKDNILQVESGMQDSENGSGATQLICGNEPFQGSCIQVPFDLPILKGHLKKKRHELDDCKDSGLLDSNVVSDVEPYSADSPDDISEEDCASRITIRKGKSRRKHHMLWSIPEVLKLVEGVSKYGVGRWTEIKRLLFPSSVHRTSVDLKDKWRNLLRASSTWSQNKRRVDPKRKQASHSIPQHILRRVRELAVIYPYPRERKTKVSQTVAIASPIAVPTYDNIVPLSTAVRV